MITWLRPKNLTAIHFSSSVLQYPNILGSFRLPRTSRSTLWSLLSYKPLLYKLQLTLGWLWVSFLPECQLSNPRHWSFPILECFNFATTCRLSFPWSMTFSAWKSTVAPSPELQHLYPQSPWPLLLITKRSRSTQTALSKLQRFQLLSLPATKRPLASQVFNLVQKLTTVRFSWTKRSELTLGLPLQLRLSHTAWVFKFRSPSFPSCLYPRSGHLPLPPSQAISLSFELSIFKRVAALAHHPFSTFLRPTG